MSIITDPKQQPEPTKLTYIDGDLVTTTPGGIIKTIKPAQLQANKEVWVKVKEHAEKMIAEMDKVIADAAKSKT